MARGRWGRSQTVDAPHYESGQPYRTFCVDRVLDLIQLNLMQADTVWVRGQGSGGERAVAVSATPTTTLFNSHKTGGGFFQPKLQAT